ncbi:MAG: HAD family hydrolase [Actinomycetota bacterium]|nr:HAD family hydrolase [Actinomycetota bacterium]MDQ3575027.1 HAD family hydrolase [Actinomycetota bacterium]
MTAIEAVTFDYWNTLVYEVRGHLRGRRLEAWSGLLEEAGFAHERVQLEAVYDVAWDTYVKSWRANQQFQAAEAAEQCVEQLGFDVPAHVRRALVDSFGRAGEKAELHLAEGVEDCLRTLKGAGIRLGIICDVGFTSSTVLRDHLIRHGVLPLFDHWSFSDEVGAYKPAPAIFEHALEGLGGPAPERVAHVGDLRRTDVAGALAMGMVTVRYTGISDDDSQPEPEALHVIVHHSELPGVLGIE